MSSPQTSRGRNPISFVGLPLSGESPESVERVFSDYARDFLETSRDSGAGGPGETFSRVFRHFGPEGSERPL